MIDLQHMVNPLGASPKALEAIKNNLSDIHKYTGPLKELLGRIAEINEVKEEQVMLSDGADGALTLIALSIFKGKNIVIPQPCFHRYKDYPSYLGVGYSLIRPKDSIFFDEEEILQSKSNVLLLASPNNPTGFEITEKFLIKVIKKFEVVILDETLLVSLTGKQNLIDNYQNLIIVRSFSKLFGLAGLRVGYIIGSAENIKKIKNISTPFKVNYLGQVASIAALNDTKYINETIKVIKEEKENLYQKLMYQEIKNSNSLCYCLKLTPKQQTSIINNKILIQKDMGFGYGTNSDSFFRLVISSPNNNKKLIEALKPVKNE